MPDAPGVPRPAPVVHGVPRVPTWNVPRRVLDHLDPAVPLTVVGAPAGFGKSALLADWARGTVAQHRAVVWVDVTESASAEGLWLRVLGTLSAAGLLDPVVTERRALVRGGQGALATATDALLGLRAPVLVVLDGYEAVAGPDVDRALVHVLRHVERLHVAVAARTRLRDLVMAAALELDVQEVGPEDLRLDEQEVAELLVRAGLDAHAAPHVRRAGDGVAVGVRAIALAAGRGTVDLAEPSPSRLADIALRGTVAALAGSRTQRSPGAARQPGAAAQDEDRYGAALVRASVAHALTPDLAALLSGGPADDLLARAEADGLGAWRSEPFEAFVLTPLVRQALRHELDRTAPEQTAPLLRTVVDWALDHALPDVALRAAVELRDLDLVTGVAIRIWSGGGSGLDPAEMLRQLETLPRVEIARRPHLALLLALHYNSGAQHRVKALEWLTVAAGATAYQYPRSSPADRAVLQAGESVALRLLGRAGRASAVARRALDGFATIEPGTNGTVDALRSLVHRQLGISLIAAGAVDEGLAVVEGAVLPGQGDSRTAFHVTSLVAGFSAAQGDVRTARLHVGVALAQDRASWPDSPYRRSTLMLAQVHLALEEGDPDGAQRLLDDMADELRTNEFWPAFAEAQGMVDLVRGRAVAGEERLAQSLRRGRRAPASAYWRARIVATRSLLALAAGHGERALGQVTSLPTEVPTVRLARARALLSTGSREEALLWLAAPDAPEEGPRVRAARRLLLAAASLAAGHEPAAAGALAQAVAIIEGDGTATAWLFVTAAERRDLVELAARTGAAPELAVPDAIPAVIPDAVANVGLSERELVVLRRLAEDTDLATVAAQLHVSHNTVKTQVRGIYRKLGVGRRTDAVLRARELGLLDGR